MPTRLYSFSMSLKFNLLHYLVMDIDLLAKMIRDVVLEKDEVALPGLGVFVAEFVPASFSDKGFTINPPYKRLTFRQEVNAGDDTLIRMYAEANNIGEVAAAHTLAEVSPDGCLNCGAPIIQRPKVKKRKFCCSDCRISWYKANPDRLNLKAMYEYVCPTCGKHFSAYGNSRRKYCSHACYIAGRFRGGDDA